MHDLKYSVAQIHHEISELRKLVESCLDWQKKLGHSIKEEVFSAINQLGKSFLDILIGVIMFGTFI